MSFSLQAKVMTRRRARENFTVDLRGLRSALKARANRDGLTESDVLRSALAVAFGDPRASSRATGCRMGLIPFREGLTASCPSVCRFRWPAGWTSTPEPQGSPEGQESHALDRWRPSRPSVSGTDGGLCCVGRLCERTGSSGPRHQPSDVCPASRGSVGRCARVPRTSGQPGRRRTTQAPRAPRRPSSPSSCQTAGAGHGSRIPKVKPHR